MQVPLGTALRNYNLEGKDIFPKRRKVRPPLEEQVTLSKLTREECIRLLMPHTPWQHIRFWVFRHLPLLHYLYCKAVCWIRPYDIDTRCRHWKWEKF